LNRLSILIASGLVLLITGLVKPTAAEIPEPPLSFLMPHITEELHGNFSIYYDIPVQGEGYDGIWDIAFLHQPDGEPRWTKYCSLSKRQGEYLYIWTGCENGGRPLVYRFKREYIAVAGPDPDTRKPIWNWYINTKTWPGKKQMPCKNYSFREIRCK